MEKATLSVIFGKCLMSSSVPKSDTSLHLRYVSVIFTVHHINGSMDYTAMCVHTESVVAIHNFLGYILSNYYSGRAQSNG